MPPSASDDFGAPVGRSLELRPCGGGERPDHVERLPVLGDVMDAQHRGAARQRDHVGGERADEALVWSAADDPADERLARQPDEDGRPQPAEPLEVPDALVILLGRLAEAQARVEQDPAERNSGAGGEPQRPRKEALDVVEDVDRRVRRLAIVHDDHRRAGLGDRVGHAGIALKAPDVIDHRGAEACGGPRHRRLRGVDREGHVEFARERLDHRRNPPQFLLGADRRMAGPSRFAADVDDRRALGRERLRMRDRDARVEMAPAVGKRIRRDVDNAHQDGRPAERGQKAVALAVTAVFSHGVGIGAQMK